MLKKSCPEFDPTMHACIFQPHTVSLCYLFIIYSFLALHGLHCCTQQVAAAASCIAFQFQQTGDYSLVVVCGLLIKLTSLVAEHGLQMWGLHQLEHVGCNSCGTQNQLPHGMWDLPGPGIYPMSPVVAGGFLTTGPSGKSQFLCMLLLEKFVQMQALQHCSKTFQVPF